jgi:3-oxoacyl-ACP reductase-like protein
LSQRAFSAFAENPVPRFHVRMTPKFHVMSTFNISFDANEFTGKRVPVTGGTKGAGKAIVDRFRRGGATVIITARSVSTEETENHFIQADVSTAEGTTKMGNEILNRFRGIPTI